METLMLLTYAALCIVVFKVFRIPLNKWTVPTAVLGGIALIGAVIFGMNYNFPYTDVGNQVFRTVPIVSQVRGRVQSVPVKPNQMLHKGDVLFTLDPTPFQAKVDDLQAQGIWLIISSTHGAGDVPDNLVPFYDALQEKQADLSAVRFGAIGIGSREYDTFCGAIDKLEAALKACGAKQIGETLKINVLEHEIPEDPAEIWLGSWKNLL
ncbi:FMN-binding protein MioC [Klebsiella pneumoniae]|uniref:FMN-binding protein MioC n=3 Tax=Pseudomonadota TaxID=1224 RepID=UPI00319DFDA3